MYSLLFRIRKFIADIDLYQARISNVGGGITFVPQGDGSVHIVKPENFRIATTSHLKSGAYVSCLDKVTIGEYFHCGQNLTIFTNNHDYESGEAIPYGRTNVLRPVVIKDFVWIGANVIILPGVTIGEGCIIGAGSVVTRNIPDCAVAAGNPAKVIKFRNKETFYRLKAEGKYI